MKNIVNQYDLGLKSLVSYRPYTCDEDIIRAVLVDRKEYHLFVGCNPRIIFDVGADIGATSLLFANSYPHALIYSFEPEPENFELLVKNVKDYENVKPFNVALGNKTETRKLFSSDDEYNLGGFSFHEAGTNRAQSKEVQVVSIRDFIANEPFSKIDLLKVDTEGCEFEIVSALADQLPDFIMGESHGVQDGAMFDLLLKTHDLRINKDFHERCFPFYAKRKHENVADT